MAITELVKLNRLAKPLTSDEGQRILERDRFTCQYCGLDGMRFFENSLIMTVDFVVPRSLKGKKNPDNLVTACRPCNVLKGNRRVFPSFEAAKEHVLKRRAALRKEWESRVVRVAGSVPASWP
jgi:5-methylcytosine-specific restriction endonuclease McrA